MKYIIPQDIKNLVNFFDEQRCREWLLDELHPDGVFCPHCGSKQELQRVIRKFYTLKKVACESCQRRFNAYTGTVFSHTRLSAKQIFLMFFLLQAGWRNKDIARLVRVSSASVSRWRFQFLGCSYAVLAADPPKYVETNLNLQEPKP